MTKLAPLATGHAPGKVILFGEHAVVYGRPAIAAPLSDVQAHAVIYPDRTCLIRAIDLKRTVIIAQAASDDPFALIVRLVCGELELPLPDWRIEVRSDIPIASGLGSGAAIAAAIARALLAGFAADLPADRLSALIYEVEKLHHGTPSGIDNSVVVYEQPIWFVRGQTPAPFAIGQPLRLLVADTGIASPTRHTVAAVHRGWQAAPQYYEARFDAISRIAIAARSAITAGDIPTLGPLMNQNQRHLAEIGVSSPALDRLCRAATDAGALGAKLSGGGGGGNMLALVDDTTANTVLQALLSAGARGVLDVTIR